MTRSLPPNRSTRALAWGGAVLLWAAAFAPAARADEADRIDGARLAAAIEGATDEERRARWTALVGRLDEAQAARFLAWTAKRWKERGWRHLATPLGMLRSRAAAEHLAEALRVSADEHVRREASQALGAIPIEAGFDLAWRGWSDPAHGEAFGPALTGMLAGDPHRGLEALESAVARHETDDPGALEDRVALLVRRAFVASEQPTEFVWGVLPAQASVGVARGLARGMSQRCAIDEEREREAARERLGLADDDAAPARDEEDDEEDGAAELEFSPSAELLQRRTQFAAVLLELAHREEPALAIDVFKALPDVLPDGLTSEWAEVLFPALEPPPELPEGRKLSRTAYVTLRRITRQTKLLQTTAAWQQWWEEQQEETP